MAVKLPNGAVVSIASTYGASKAMSVITNATEAVATLASGHSVIVNDIVEITSGWSKLSGRIARAKAVATDDVTLEEIDTSSTTKYPAGSGVGSVREITAWTQITQIVSWQSQGGDQQFTNYSFLDDDTQRQLATFKSAQSINFELGDDQSLAWFDILTAADEDRLPRAIRVVLPSGAVLYYNATVSFNKTPTTNKDNIMTCKGVLSLAADVTRYAS